MMPQERNLRRLTAEEIFEPWEMVGESRRDSAPHCAGLLRAMGYASVIAGGTSLCCLMPAAIGLLVGLTVLTMAHRDLDMMQNGTMDQGGYHGTQKARSDAHAGTCLSLISMLLWSVGVAICITINH